MSKSNRFGVTVGDFIKITHYFANLVCFWNMKVAWYMLSAIDLNLISKTFLYMFHPRVSKGVGRGGGKKAIEIFT